MSDVLVKRRLDELYAELAHIAEVVQSGVGRHSRAWVIGKRFVCLGGAAEHCAHGIEQLFFPIGLGQIPGKARRLQALGFASLRPGREGNNGRSGAGRARGSPENQTPRT